jgi:hypothetical protein
VESATFGGRSSIFGGSDEPKAAPYCHAVQRMSAGCGVYPLKRPLNEVPHLVG